MVITKVSLGVNGRELVRLNTTGERDHDIQANCEVEYISWQVDTDHPILSDDIDRQGMRLFTVSMKHILPLDQLPPLHVGVVRELNDGPLAMSLNIAVLAILQRIEDELVRHRRLGPIRLVPPRIFRPQPQPSRDDWLTGVAAWDQLGFVTPKSLASINEWLGPEKLDTGIRVRLEYMISLEEGFEIPMDPKGNMPFLKRDLMGRNPREILLIPIDTKYGGAFTAAHTLLPSQVGTGISQIIPVVVACLIRGGLLDTIAQPELHLHPRLQVKLGDLFIDLINEHEYAEPSNQLIVETHSEHLILRLLRRVRETTKQCVPHGLELMSQDVVVYHASQECGATVLRKRDIDANGQFVQPWPDDFFEIDFYERFQTGTDDAN